MGAVCPFSTRSGLAAPPCGKMGGQMAMLASSPAVTMRPSGRKATAFTALSWNLSTRSAPAGTERPDDGRRIEAAGDRAAPVRRDRHRPHRAAMAAQLRQRGRGGHAQRQQQRDKDGLVAASGQARAGSGPRAGDVPLTQGLARKPPRGQITAPSAHARPCSRRGRRAPAPWRQSADRAAGPDSACSGGRK